MPKILSRQKMYDGKIYTSESLTLELDNGDIIHRNLIVKSPCVVALVRHATRDTAILAKEFRIGTMSNEYGFVSGMIDEGEHPFKAMRRELKEETGYDEDKIINIEYLGTSFTSSGFTNEQMHHFYIEIDGEPEEQDLDEGEHVEVIEVPFYSLGRMFAKQEIIGEHAHTCYLKYLIRPYAIEEN